MSKTFRSFGRIVVPKMSKSQVIKRLGRLILQFRAGAFEVGDGFNQFTGSHEPATAQEKGFDVVRITRQRLFQQQVAVDVFFFGERDLGLTNRCGEIIGRFLDNSGEEIFSLGQVSGLEFEIGVTQAAGRARGRKLGGGLECSLGIFQVTAGQVEIAQGVMGRAGF
ncbi:MAG: hypothetical protein ABI042_15110 [Verrucomicrobiota bacterium]